MSASDALILSLPFLGTVLGASSVLFVRKKSDASVSPVLCGIAAGIMTAASIWSLILPSIEESGLTEKLSFLPACIGFFCGNIFMVILDKVTDRMLYVLPYGIRQRKNLFISFFAMTLHNLPEGMAVGMAFAAADNHKEKLFGAAALSIGIALQNLPEGAVSALPFYSSGMKRQKAFFLGALSGLPELFGAFATIFVLGQWRSFMPYLMSFAAGTMMFVVMSQLSGEMKQKKPVRGILGFSLGFCLMMSLDVALG